MDHHLAQVNIGRMRGTNIEDLVMQEFVENLDRINGLAEKSAGFIWRLKDEHNNATHFNPYEDKRIIINLSVWRDLESFERFVYHSDHLNFIKRRMEWFEKFEKSHLALWFIPAGHLPTISEAVHKLDYLHQRGPSAEAFDFRRKFPPPDGMVTGT